MKRPSQQGSGFISYRREPSEALAKQLRDRLALALPKWRFFHDLGNLAGGAKFKAEIEAALADADLIIVVIDRNWIGAGSDGRPARILDEGDYVRLEVSTALKRGIRTIPILVNDAPLPGQGEVPADIAGIRAFNAVKLRLDRFEDDFANLVEAIAGARPASASSPRPLRWIARAFLGAVAAGVIGVAALVGLFALTGKPLHHWTGGPEAALLAFLWLVSGALLAVKRRA